MDGWMDGWMDGMEMTVTLRPTSVAEIWIDYRSGSGEAADRGWTCSDSLSHVAFTATGGCSHTLC